MPAPTRFPELVVSGTPRELGRQIGEGARAQLRGFAEVALRCVNKTVRISRDRAIEVARKSAVHVESYAPHMLEELSGMSEASGVSIDDLMLLQVRNQLTSDGDAGCTSLSLAKSANETGRSIVSQNWDNDPELDEFTLVLTRRPVGRPALLNLTQAGLIAYIGFNDAGIGACLNTLPAPSRPVGVPHYFTLRAIYEQTTLDDAVAAVRRAAPRAIPANIMLATPQGPADLEVTIDDVHVLRDTGTGRVTHTNHGLHPELAAINDQYPALIETHARKIRIDQLAGPIGRCLRLADVQATLADHAGYPRSICRHSNDDPQHGFWQTIFGVIIDPEAGELHATRGTPCDHSFEVYYMSRGV